MRRLWRSTISLIIIIRLARINSRQIVINKGIHLQLTIFVYLWKGLGPTSLILVWYSSLTYIGRPLSIYPVFEYPTHFSTPYLLAAICTVITRNVIRAVHWSKLHVPSSWSAHLNICFQALATTELDRRLGTDDGQRDTQRKRDQVNVTGGMPVGRPEGWGVTTITTVHPDINNSDDDDWHCV